MNGDSKPGRGVTAPTEADDTVDPRAPGQHGHTEAPTGRRLLVLSLGALGIVFGDIGTSPLYAVRESFNPTHGVAATPENVLGILSLISWALVLVIVVKYLTFMLRADNRGEGGILALLALLIRSSEQRTKRPALLIGLGLFGSALLYGEGVITPAISVLSAVEGLEVATPRFTNWVVPITMVILLGIFLVQKHGTARVGAVFGPITLLWFLSLSATGIGGILREPEVLRALNPWHAVVFFAHNGVRGYLVLGAVVLAVTGAEALYADMGHFGVKPIRLGWFAVVFPALLLNYFGQGALLLTAVQPVDNPFFALVPRWGLYPMVGLAMAATVIASQALISGSFSLTRQAVQLGYLPRMEIVHTSERTQGQIYIPAINWALMVACLTLVLGFRDSSKLAAAYGLAVVGTMAIGTILFTRVARERFHWRRRNVVLFALFFLTIEFALLGANAVKFAHGAWLPLVIGLALFTLMSTWKRGRQLLAEHFERGSLPVDLFVREITRKPPHRVPGNAIFLTANPDGVPPVLLHHLKHNKVLHEQVALVSFVTVDVPHVGDSQRLDVRELGAGLFRVRARYGFMEIPDTPEFLRACARQGLKLKPSETTFYLGRETLIARNGRGLAKWRKQLFGVMQRNAQTASAFYNIPPNAVVELGAQVEI